MFDERLSMKSFITILAVAILIANHAGATTNSISLVQVDSRDFGDTNTLMKIVELERNANTSKLRLTYKKRGSSVGSSLFIVRGFYEVAKARGTEYFVNLKEWDDQDGGRIYIAGFTNAKDADLKQEFGQEYDYENDSGQKRGYMSIAQFGILFDRQKATIEQFAAANSTANVSQVEAKVLKAYVARDGNAVFRAYVVNWKGQEIVVSDMLARSNLKEGDPIKFVAQKHDSHRDGQDAILTFWISPEVKIPIVQPVIRQAQQPTITTTTPTHQIAPNYLAMKQVDTELNAFIKSFWRGQGMVIVGRVAPPPDAKVTTRTQFFSDGSYCTALYPGRKLIFFAHGYDPLQITRAAEIATNVFDAGIVRFMAADPSNIRTLKAIVTANSTNRADLSITCVLRIRNNEYLLGDAGDRGGASLQVDVETRKILPSDTIQFSRLSRIPYILSITAPGYIRKDMEIDPKQNGEIDLGNIALEPASRFNISYRARVRQKGGVWIADAVTQTATVVCNGETQFMFSNERDGLGNSLALRLHPRAEGVEASFFYKKPASFFQLESGSIDEFAGKDIDVGGVKGMATAILQDGKLYFFRIADINGTDIELLFQPKKM